MKSNRKKLTKLFWIIVLILIMSINGIAQKTIELNDSFDYLDLSSKVQIMPDSSNTLNIKKVSERLGLFKSYDKSYKTGDYCHWISFKLKNTQNVAVAVILSYNTFADSISTFIATDKGFESIDSPQSWKTPNQKRIYPNIRFPIFRFSLLANEQKQVYIKLQKKDGGFLKLPLILYKKTEFEKYYNKDEIFHGFYFGWMFFVSLFSFTFYLFLNEKIYLFYCLSVLFSILNLTANHGLLNQHYGWLPVLISGPSGIVFFSLAYFILNIEFLHLYLDTKQNSLKWVFNFSKYYQYFIYFLLFLLIFNKDFYYYKYSYLVYNPLALIYIVLVIMYIIDGIKQKNVPSVYYLIAIFPLFLIAFIYLLSSLGLATLPLELARLFKVAVLFEIFVLSVGLGHRYFIIKKEKSKLELILIQAQNQIISSQETERKRLAQDLHDDLGGTLSAIKGKVANETQNPATLKLVEKAIEDLRSISRNLLPPELAKNGLSKAIQQSIERLQSASKIAFTVITFGSEKRMSEERELNIYRVISELLNNIVKHSKATKATIQVIFYDEYVHISVEDNGVGIKTEEKNWGIGLKNVNSRIELLKAKFLKDSNENGTIFIIEVSYI